MKREYVRTIVVFENHFKESSIATVKGLFEIRVEYGSNIFRIFCCFDEGKIVVLLNGIQKKTQKTPKEEIDKAEILMKKYFKLKNNAEDEGPY